MTAKQYAKLILKDWIDGDGHVATLRKDYPELFEAYQWLRWSVAEAPDETPAPHPGGRLKCLYCHEGFVMWGDVSVHERSCPKRPDTREAVERVNHCEHGVVYGYACTACNQL